MIGLGIGNIHLTRKAENRSHYVADSTKRADDSLRNLTTKEYEDSLKSYHNYTTELLARYGLKVDTLTNTVNKFDTSIQKETPPTLAILGGLYFDSSSTTKEKRLSYNLNALNADVHLLGYRYFILNVKRIELKDIIFDGPPIPTPGMMNFTTIIPAGGSQAVSWFVDRIKGAGMLRDTFFLAMDFIYKSKGNKVQTPLRKVYMVFLPQKYVIEAPSFEFMEVAYYLKKYKFWSKFYDL
jgi:hypothetical protein